MIYLYGIALDSADPARVARFWDQALEYDQQQWSQEEIDAALAAHPEWRDRAVVEDAPMRHPRLYIQRVPEAKEGRNRVRFEVWTPLSRDDEVARLRDYGASLVGDDHLRDPDGNEFNVVERNATRRFGALVIDALDPERQAEFWSATLRFELQGTACVPPTDWLRVEAGRLVAHGSDLGAPFPGGQKPTDGAVHTLAPGLRFVATNEPKRRKNRIHLDLVCSPDAIPAERERAAGRGATFEDPSTGHRGMFDPEGNEFCLHDPRLDT